MPIDQQETDKRFDDLKKEHERKTGDELQEFIDANPPAGTYRHNALHIILGQKRAAELAAEIATLTGELETAGRVAPRVAAGGVDNVGEFLKVYIKLNTGEFVEEPPIFEARAIDG